MAVVPSSSHGQAAGTTIPLSTVTAAGDLIVGTGNGTVGRLGVGAAGTVLGGGATPGYVVPPGTDLNYTPLTSTINIVSTTEATGTVVLSPGAVVFDGTPVWCEVQAVITLPTAAVGNVFVISLFEAATQITRLVSADSAAVSAQQFNTVYGKYRFTPTAASHTYTITAFVSSATGTPSAVGANGGTAGNPPGYVRFFKA